MTPQQAAICKVFSGHMNASLLQDRQAEITATHGAAVYTEARRIVQEAIATPVDWSKASMERALDAMFAMLGARYPWLTRDALIGVQLAYTMTWK
jgi:hypothetical protein